MFRKKKKGVVGLFGACVGIGEIVGIVGVVGVTVRSHEGDEHARARIRVRRLALDPGSELVIVVVAPSGPEDGLHFPPV